jgi:uncharacterized protein (TIGR00645 family)
VNRIERGVEAIVFGSRWLIMPFLLGLIAGLVMLVYKFLLKLVEFVKEVESVADYDVIVAILKLIDLTLTANLILIVICSTYENFVCRVDRGRHPGWPEGLFDIGFSGLKQKLLGSIAAIAAVNVLEWFMDLDRNADSVKLIWVVGILLAFAVAMFLMALADRASNAAGNHSR